MPTALISNLPYLKEAIIQGAQRVLGSGGFEVTVKNMELVFGKFSEKLKSVNSKIQTIQPNMP